MPSSSTSKHKIIDIDIYAQAILEGAGDGLVHLVETFSHPIDNIVVPVSLLVFDAAVVLSEQDITPEFNGYLKTNSAIVTDSRRRMNERIDAIQNLGDEFMQAEARRGFSLTGILISTSDAESFIRGSADAGMLRIVR